MAVKDIFGNTRFTLYEISEFIDSKKSAFSFATVTTKEHAAFSIPENNFFFSFENYFGEGYNEIISQAADWVVKVVRTEDWDPSIYENKGRTTEEYYKKIDSEFILVKDNKFAGIISYKSDFESYKILYALVEDYDNEPLFAWSIDGYGSSDHDMMYTEKYYLTKKDCQK